MFRIVKIFIIGFLFSFSQLYASDTITLAFSDVESFPYQMGKGIGLADPPGVALEIISKSVDDLGRKVLYKRLPNRRVQSTLRRGEIDGAFIFSYKKSRLLNGRYPFKKGKLDAERRIAVLSYFLYKKKGSDYNWNKRNSSTIVGANSGYSIVSDLQKMKVTVQEANTTEQNIKMLQLGRLHFYAAQDIIVDAYLKRRKIVDIEKVEVPLKTKDYFLMLSYQFVNKYPKVAELLWTKIGENRDDVINRSAFKYMK